MPNSGNKEPELITEKLMNTPPGTEVTPALAVQVGGSHYKNLKIQPVEYITANEIPYLEGNVIKYITRWRSKGGIDDLNKAKHYIDLIIDMEKRERV